MYHGGEERIRPREFPPGSYVLVHTPDLSKGHKMKARGTGPWRVTVSKDSYVELEDPFMGRPWMSLFTGLPEQISKDRLIRF